MTKHFFYFVSITLIASLFFTSCSKKSNIIETAVYSYEENYYLTEDENYGVLTVDMSVELPETYHNQKVLGIIRNELVKKLFGDKYINIKNDRLLIEYATDLADEFKINNLPLLEENVEDYPLYVFNNDYSIESFSLQNDGKVYSYGAHIYVYMGGAHGLLSRSYYNYDLDNGNIITQKDIFTKDGLRNLPELIKSNIIKNADFIDSEESFEDIYWVDQIIPNDNFYITSEGLTYVFNPYEIAPYAIGHTEVFLSFLELENFMSEETPIDYLFKN